MSDKSRLLYRRNGAVYRDAIRIAWIVREDDVNGKACWALRMTPASGQSFVGKYATRKDARYVLETRLRHG